MNRYIKYISIHIILSIFLLNIIGCASSGPTTTFSNRKNLNQLEIGMSKAEVINIMGEPYQREAFLNEKEQAIEVLLYQTHFVGIAIRANDSEITPLVLQ